MSAPITAKRWLPGVRRATRFLSCVLSLCMLVGCIIAPVPMRTRARVAPGAEDWPINLRFLKVGTTTRDEVQEKLGWLYTTSAFLQEQRRTAVCRDERSFSAQRVFWARWQNSKWGIAGVVPFPGGGPIPVPVDERNWKYKNLLVEFDEKGVRQRFIIVPDRKLKSALDSFDGCKLVKSREEHNA